MVSFFTLSCDSSLLFLAINPHLPYLSIVHISRLLSMNLLRGNLHSIHHHPAINSFPSAITWKAKSPVTYVSMVSELINRASLNSYLILPCSLFSIWRCHVATILRPLASLGSIVVSINFPVSLWHMSSQREPQIQLLCCQ